MSEELTKLIDKTIGKKGRLRVPAYWMHKVLSGIVGYVRAQVEKLEKLQEITPGIIEHVKERLIDKTVILNQAKPAYIPAVPNMVRLSTKDAGVYKLYTFLRYNSLLHTTDSITQHLVKFGLYEVTILKTDISSLAIRQMNSSYCYIHAVYSPPGAGIPFSLNAQPIEGLIAYVYGKKQPSKNLYSYTENSARVTISVILLHISLAAQDEGFRALETLKEIEFAGRKNIMTYEFAFCTGLTRVECDENLVGIENGAFKGCAGLSQFILHSTVPPYMYGDNIFDETNDAFTIYTPDNSVESYKNAKDWSNYRDRIRPISDIYKL